MTDRPDYSLISTILRRGAELDREAGLVKCARPDCHGGRDYTTTDGLCHWCDGTGYKKEQPR